MSRKLLHLVQEVKLQIPEYVKQIEEWTLSTFSDVIFDFNYCDWSMNTSIFGKSLIGRSNLIIYMEDTKGNVFGGYINETIMEIHPFIEDPRAFVFSLHSNGRFNKPMKFEIKSDKAKKAFHISKEDEFYGELFSFGYSDICIVKKDATIRNHCKQDIYNYHAKRKTLVGKETTKFLGKDKNYFNLKKLQVWQMQQTDEKKKTNYCFFCLY